MTFSWPPETAAVFSIMRQQMLSFTSVKKLKDTLDEIHPTKGTDSLVNIISSFREFLMYGNQEIINPV